MVPEIFVLSVSLDSDYGQPLLPPELLMKPINLNVNHVKPDVLVVKPIEKCVLNVLLLTHYITEFVEKLEIIVVNTMLTDNVNIVHMVIEMFKDSVMYVTVKDISIVLKDVLIKDI